MIAAKYRLFSAEPKLVSSRDTRTEEAAVLGISIWSPCDKSRMVGYRKLSGFDGGISPAASVELSRMLGSFRCIQTLLAVQKSGSGESANRKQSSSTDPLEVAASVTKM